MTHALHAAACCMHHKTHETLLATARMAISTVHTCRAWQARTALAAAPGADTSAGQRLGHALQPVLAGERTASSLQQALCMSKQA